MMRETRKVSERYAEMGEELVENEATFDHIRHSEATIVYLASNKAKKSHGRPVLGECEKVADKNQWAIPADFTITIYEPNCIGMDDEHLKRVIFHELLHVGIAYDKDGEETYSIVPHDLEDFRECVGRWGTDWASNKQRIANP